MGIIKNSIQSALKFIEINFGLPLTCSYEIVLKNEYIYHVIVNSLCLNQVICELFMNLFWNTVYDNLHIIICWILGWLVHANAGKLNLSK